MSEVATGAPDREVIARALAEGRILLTEDKDFGWLVYVSAERSAGVVLIRFPVSARSALARATVSLVAEQGQSLEGSFVVLQPGLIRISRPPGASS